MLDRHMAARLVLAGTLLAGRSAFATAQTLPTDLTRATLEDLMNIEITSVSRKIEQSADAPAAVYVITHDQIVRSGMTTLPDLLRLVPGVDVAQINSNKWAVSVRGFNGLYANKLLVLVDGRSLYNNLFSGVIWDTEDVMLDDVERVEVIRGPGAVMWGANAVNGVINIVTRSAADTPGGLVRIDGGTAEAQGAIRYGGTLGRGAYRVYSQWTGRGSSLDIQGSNADDASHSVTTGVRGDWSRPSDAFTADASITTGQARALWLNLDPSTAGRSPISNTPSESLGGHALGRWTHTRPDGASLQVQSFLDFAQRQEPVGDYRRRTGEVDAQYHVSFGARHDVVAGGSFRALDERFAGHPGLMLVPARTVSTLTTAFAQDEIGIVGNRLTLTIGAQVQDDSWAGAGAQPTARMMWKVTPRQRLWAAASRALRTPSLLDHGLRLEYPTAIVGGLPVNVSVFGNATAQTEHFVEVETGYRFEVGAVASIDVTAFAGRYDDLETYVASAPLFLAAPSPHVQQNISLVNALQANTHGLELAGYWKPAAAWRVDASYTALQLVAAPADGLSPGGSLRADGDAPRHQWKLGSAFALGRRGTLDAMLLHVGELEQLQVPAYTRADLRAEWRLTARLSAIVDAQNLLDASHAEFAGTDALLLPTRIPRSARLRLKWLF